MWNELSRYEGRDLRNLDDADNDKLFDLLEKLFPKYCETSSITDPYYVWTVQDEKRNILRYIVVDGEQIQKLPGGSRACISLFDEVGRLVATSEFSTGWRIDIKDVELIKDSIIGVPVIVILSGSFGGRDIGRQYYALFNDEVVLIRLEDVNGTVIPNRYTGSTDTIGPTVVKRSLDEWEAALCSDNEVEILLALIWIGGIHDDSASSGQFGPKPYRANSRYVEQVRRLRRRKRVQERLSRLRASDNQWVREGAQLAANSNPV
jgi:hypothetical protein